jgi:hypothetical protein
MEKDALPDAPASRERRFFRDIVHPRSGTTATAQACAERGPNRQRDRVCPYRNIEIFANDVDLLIGRVLNQITFGYLVTKSMIVSRIANCAVATPEVKRTIPDGSAKR